MKNYAEYKSCRDQKSDGREWRGDERLRRSLDEEACDAWGKTFGPDSLALAFLELFQEVVSRDIVAAPYLFHIQGASERSLDTC